MILCVMKNRLSTLCNQCACCLLLVVVFGACLLSTGILCIESDGTASIETSVLGQCHLVASEHQTEEADDKENAHDHDHCVDCSDISLSQQVLTKGQSDTEDSMSPIRVTASLGALEIVRDTKPIVMAIRRPYAIPNQHHKHLQTIIFLI